MEGAATLRLSREFARLCAVPPSFTPTPMVGLEHEYYLTFGGRPRDFRRIIHQRPVDGRRLDPGDVNAYRLRSGLALTCDDAEAEVASPPVPFRKAFSDELRRWARHGEATVRQLLPPGVEMKGASTHLSISVPDRLQDEACHLYARRFAPSLMLLAERPDSHGIMVRPRPGRLELCTEYNTGDRLELLTIFAAGSVSACAGAAEIGHAGFLPPALAARVEPCADRAGLQVRRGAFGGDVLSGGREALLDLEAGGATLAGTHLRDAWRAARPHVAKAASRGQLLALDALVGSETRLPVQSPPEGPPPTGIPAPTSPFGRIVDPFVNGDIFVRPVAATWDFTLLAIERGSRRAYAAIPREALSAFLRECRGAAVRHVLAAYLATGPRGRRLDCFCQLEEPALWDEVAPLAQLLRPERTTFGEPASGVRLLSGTVPSAAARPDKGGIPGIPPPPPPPPPPAPPAGPGRTPGPPPVGGTPTSPAPPPPTMPPCLPPARPWKHVEHRVGEFEIPVSSAHEHATGTRPTVEQGSSISRRLVLIGTAITAALVALGAVVGITMGRGGTTDNSIDGSGVQPSATTASGDEPSPGRLTTPEQGAGRVDEQTPGTDGGSGASPSIATSPAAVATSPPAVATSPPAVATSPPAVATSPPAVATSPPAVATSPPAAATTPPPPVLSGNRTVTFAVKSNPGNHPCAVASPIEMNFLITRDRSTEPNPVTIRVTGPGLPTMNGATVIGPSFDSQGGTASASGKGPYCGFTTSYEIAFTITPNGVSGTLTIGGDGALPGGQALVLSFTGGAPH